MVENKLLNLDWATLSPKKASKLNSPFAPLIDKLLAVQEANKRLLIVSRDVHMPQSASVVTIDKVMSNFAMCYTYNKLTGIKMAYTLNYGDLLDVKSHLQVTIEP